MVNGRQGNVQNVTGDGHKKKVQSHGGNNLVQAKKRWEGRENNVTRSAGRKEKGGRYWPVKCYQLMTIGVVMVVI